MNNPEINKVQQAIYNNFILLNAYQRRENEIFNLETFLKVLKNNKKAKLDLMNGQILVDNLGEITPIPCFDKNSYVNINNFQNFGRSIPKEYFKINQNIKEDEILLKKIINDELEHTRVHYQKVTKQAINEKNLSNSNKTKIEELKKEINILKYPEKSLTKQITNLSDFTNNNLTTAPSSQKHKEILKLNNNLGINENKNEEIFEQLNDEQKLKKNTIIELNSEIEKHKSFNDKLEKDIINFNNELTEKFSQIFQLEMKLGKLKIKRKNRIDHNIESVKLI